MDVTGNLTNIEWLDYYKRVIIRSHQTYRSEGFMILKEEAEIFNLIKKYPDELGFVLQERDYAAYIDTFGASDEVVLTEEQFYKLKTYFTKIKEDHE